MATRLLTKILHVHNKQNILIESRLNVNYEFTRGLKNKLLFKRKSKSTIRKRDGKERTVDHLYWEMHFKNNPQILEERVAMNVKNAKPGGTKPMGPTKIYDILTTSDKRLGYAAVFFLVCGFIGMKITFS